MQNSKRIECETQSEKKTGKEFVELNVRIEIDHCNIHLERDNKNNNNNKFAPNIDRPV